MLHGYRCSLLRPLVQSWYHDNKLQETKTVGQEIYFFQFPPQSSVFPLLIDY